MGFTLYQFEMMPGVPSKTVFDRHGMTVGQLLAEFAEQYGEQVLENLLLDGEISEEVMVALNGTIIRASQNPLAAVIPAGSELVLSMLIAGG